MSRESSYGFSTRAIHAGQPPEPRTGAVVTPIFQTSTYAQRAFGEPTEYEYGRGDNPTRGALEANIAALEGGARGLAFASGMAAIATLLTLVEAGERVVCSTDVYGGTYRFFHRILERYGIEFAWIDTTDLGRLEAAMTPNTRLVYIETPTNPLMHITDLAGAAEIAHAHGAKLAVDNTFLSPYLQRPIEHGADVVVHSATKFLNGHSDCLGGLLVAADPEDGEWFHLVQKSSGGILGPFDSFLVSRGIKTLAVRQDRHEKNSRAIADYLAGHRKVGKVLYPGLPEHPGHEVHRRQASGFGSMITFDVGTLDAARRMLDGVEVILLAESLGGVESLISHPATMTHASVPPERREELGIEDGLVRLSVGIEDLDDLLGDLAASLDRI